MDKKWKKDITLFILSQTISLFGSSLVMYAIMWYITLTTQSGVMMTISILCSVLPTFFLSPFAGVWADRYNRKKIIILADSFIAITTLILAIIFLLGNNAIVLLFSAAVFRAIGGGIQSPAVSAFIPQIVPEEQLMKVQGINGSIQSTVTLLSPMLSGVLLTFATIESIFFIDVVTAIIAVVILLLFIKTPTHRKASEEQKTSYYLDLLEGIRYVKKHAYLRKYFIFIAFFMFLIAPVAFLSPLQVTRSFGNDVWRLTAIEITFSAGMIVGGIIIASWGGFKNKIHTMMLSCLIIGVTTIALGIVPYFWLYLIIMAIIGSTLPLFNTPSMVLLQEKVEEDIMGRVFGVMGMIGSGMMPLAMLLFGPLADFVAIEFLLIVTGSLIFIQSFFLVGSKDLIDAGKPKEIGIENL